MKVALVYDRVNKWGGAERVLELLHEIFPDAPLYTSVYNPKTAKWADKFKIKTSFLQNFPFARFSHEWYALLMPFAFESFSFDEYDLVISVTSEAAKGIITKPHTKHICICLTPTRYLWSGYSEYFKNPWLRIVSRPIIWYLRRWDKMASNRPDSYIAISKEVQGRIKKYYQKESEVIYPPLTLRMNKNDKHPERLSVASLSNTKVFFLVVSRLVPIKKIDIAVRACNRLKLPLKIIGKGSEEKRLKKIAGSTISFLGNLTDTELVEYYKGCCALLFPGIEDFGLTVIEAQSSGKPVIAFRSGGTLETIIEGKTGEFFYPQTEKALADTISQLLKSGKLKIDSLEQTYYKEECVRQGAKFTKEQFKKKLGEYIEK